MAASPQVKALKLLIFLYLILLILEGGLRKWWLPSLATPLLIARDPVVLLIYALAASSRRFVINGYVVACLLLAMTTFCAGFLAPSTNVFVSMIGMHCYFLHLPLIFVMEKTLEEEDIQRMCKFLFWIVIPETLLVIDQFYSAQSARVNVLIGGIVGEGMSGASGHFRPSGTFSFTTGVAEFYPLVLAALLSMLMARKKLPNYLSVASAVCIIFGIFFSISRTNALTCAIMLLVAGASVLILPNPPKLIMRTVLLAGVVMLVVSWFPRFDDGVEAFESRWAASTGQSAGGVKTAIVARFFDALVPPAYVFIDAPILGYGVGYGTNMAQGWLGGARSFALGEDEWPRIIYEMGPVLGLAFIALRIGLCARIVKAAYFSIRRKNIMPALFAVEAFLLVLNAQWAQPTTLGFAMFSSGLVLALARISVPGVVSTKRRQSYSRSVVANRQSPTPALPPTPVLPEASPQS